jgi:hypothetical protein
LPFLLGNRPNCINHGAKARSSGFPDSGAIVRYAADRETVNRRAADPNMWEGLSMGVCGWHTANMLTGLIIGT